MPYGRIFRRPSSLQLTDLQALAQAQTGGGPVALRIKPYMSAMNGSDAEKRIGEKAESIDKQYGLEQEYRRQLLEAWRFLLFRLHPVPVIIGVIETEGDLR